uniref:DNA-directed RNA polymerase III subunit RPC6 n=1 Tax=Timema douglasi TaxID=61478 RepID=A0A7R8ZET8_TIMDO|nr:unnamed protein product [Timema douglasi]
MKLPEEGFTVEHPVQDLGGVASVSDCHLQGYGTPCSIVFVCPRRIIALAKASAKGISDKDIQKEIPDLRPDQRAVVINKLLVQGYFDLFNQGGTLLYKLKDPALLTDKIKGADNEEKIVYSIIEEAGNRSVTGGAWYCDQDFEAEFVDVLNQQCYRYLQQKSENIKDCKGGPIAARNISYASSKDVWKFISELGISKVQLSVEDIETILDTLLYDGKVERSVALDGSYLYRAIESLLAAPGIVRMPCEKYTFPLVQSGCIVQPTLVRSSMSSEFEKDARQKRTLTVTREEDVQEPGW